MQWRHRMDIPQSERLADTPVNRTGLEGWPDHLRGAKFNAPSKAKKRSRKYRRKGNTFGAASPCVSHSADEREEWTRNNARVSPPRASDRKSRRSPHGRQKGVAIEASNASGLNANVKCALASVIGFRLSPLREKDEWIEFVAESHIGSILACVSTHPMRCARQRRGGRSVATAAVDQFFAELDRRVFGGASCRRHTNRLVVLQSADGVGWHAHVQIMTPKRFTRSNSQSWQGIWIALLGGKKTGPFRSSFSGQTGGRRPPAVHAGQARYQQGGRAEHAPHVVATRQWPYRLQQMLLARMGAM